MVHTFPKSVHHTRPPCTLSQKVYIVPGAGAHFPKSVHPGGHFPKKYIAPGPSAHFPKAQARAQAQAQVQAQAQAQALGPGPGPGSQRSYWSQ